MSAHHTYYSGLVGAWAGECKVEIFGRPAGGRLQLLRAGAFRALARSKGPLVFATTLAMEGDEVRHTTQLTKWGVPVFNSRERIRLLPDGRHIELHGEQVFGPAPLGMQPFDARGSVDDDALGAIYFVPWFGGILEQRTKVIPDGLDLVQVTTWSKLSVVLKRRRIK
jgi:hypothetical protein